MKIHQLKCQLELPITMSQAWEFFSNPENLQEITPPNLSMDIVIKPDGKMYPGMMITYQIYPLMKIPMSWVTEITHVNEPNYFVDEQRFGPYKLWHHEHRFETSGNGVLATDIVTYSIGKGFIGEWMHSLWIKKQLEGIFTYREKVLAERFS